MTMLKDIPDQCSQCGGENRFEILCSKCGQIAVPTPEASRLLRFAPLTGSAASWQQIETAPRDGTSILVWDGYTQTVALWGYDDLWNHEPKDWIYGQCSGEYNVYSTVDSPTHWMPLPQPPNGRISCDTKDQ